MANNSTDDFYLDTKNMDSVIHKVQAIAKMMQTCKEDYREAVTKYTEGWVGKGRNMFDRKSAQLMQTLTDVSQSFYDIGEELLAASEAYIQVDTENAKAADGKQKRF